MFKITQSKGFHLSFENGYTVSVQFGRGNYSSNYHLDSMTQSDTAEFAAWGPDEDFLEIEGHDVHGYLTADEVLRLINLVANLEVN